LRSQRSKYCVGVVVDYDVIGKRVKFHFPKTKSTRDEWIEVGSSRIAPLNTKVFKQEKSTANSKLKQQKPSQVKLLAGSSLSGRSPEVNAYQTAATAENAEEPHQQEIRMTKESLVENPNEGASTPQTALVAKNDDEATERESKEALKLFCAIGNSEAAIANNVKSSEENWQSVTEQTASVCDKSSSTPRRQPLQGTQEIDHFLNESSSNTKRQFTDECGTPITKDIEQDDFTQSLALMKTSDTRVLGDEHAPSKQRSAEIRSMKQNEPETSSKAGLAFGHQLVPRSLAVTNPSNKGLNGGTPSRFFPKSTQSKGATSSKRPAKDLSSGVLANMNSFSSEKATPLANVKESEKEVSKREPNSTVPSSTTLSAVTSSNRPVIDSDLTLGVLFNTSIPRKRFRTENNFLLEGGGRETFSTQSQPMMQRIPRKVFHKQESNSAASLPQFPHQTMTPVSYNADRICRPPVINDAASKWDNKMEGPPLERATSRGFAYPPLGPRPDSFPLAQPSNSQIKYGRNISQRFHPPPPVPPSPSRRFQWPNRQDHER
jgi:hypothetical protein